MGNQPYELNPAARERAGGNRPPTIANLPAVTVPVAGAPRPAVGTHQCPNCGAWAPSGSSVCGECGTRLHTKPQKIRCRLCGGQAQATLVICPQCGRELHPAPSRIFSWGAPAILVLLFALILFQRWESGNPLQWVQSGVAEGRAWVDSVAERLDPQITISTLPAGASGDAATDALLALPVTDQENTGAPVDNSTTAPAPAIMAENSAPQGENAQNTAPTADVAATTLTTLAVVTPTATVAEVPATATALPTVPPTAVPTTPAPTATALPPTPTTIALATSTSLPTATVIPRQTPLSAIVQALPVVTTPETVTVASANAQTITHTILQPTPTTAPPTATPTAAAVTYVVQAGDTPLGIANQFDISVDELLARNGLSVSDARRLRVGQVLLIANAAPPPTATPTATLVSATATSAPTWTSTPTSAPTNTPQPTTRLDAPVLRSPERGSSLSCSGNNSLIWLPVAFIRDTDQYLLHLGYLNGNNSDGSEQVTWILEQWRPSNVTLWDLDEGLCGLAPQAFGRQWRWYVEVVEPAGKTWQPVSPPSAISGFSWN